MTADEGRGGLVLDLFSGTGSATQPFVECGRHRVVRIDIAGKPDVRSDVRHLPIRGDVEFVWASPPCQEFSQLTNLRKVHGLPGPDPVKGMPLVRAAFSACRSARHYAVENVRGSVPHISAEFGRPAIGWGGRWLWTDLNLPMMPHPTRDARKPARVKGMRQESAEWFRSRGFGLTFKEQQRARSMIPRPLAEAVHRAVCDFVPTPSAERGGA